MSSYSIFKKNLKEFLLSMWILQASSLIRSLSFSSICSCFLLFDSICVRYLNSHCFFFFMCWACMFSVWYHGWGGTLQACKDFASSLYSVQHNLVLSEHEHELFPESHRKCVVNMHSWIFAYPSQVVLSLQYQTVPLHIASDISLIEKLTWFHVWFSVGLSLVALLRPQGAGKRQKKMYTQRLVCLHFLQSINTNTHYHLTPFLTTHPLECR